MKLTDSKIRGLRGHTRRYIEWDEGSGLGVRVSPVGRKSFVFMYRFDGKARMMTIGTYPKLTLAEARTKAATAKEEVSKGNDPGKSLVEKKREDRKAPTVEGLVEEYLEKWAKPRKRTWKEDERILYKDVIPLIGRRKAKDIKKPQPPRNVFDVPISAAISPTEKKMFRPRTWAYGYRNSTEH